MSDAVFRNRYEYEKQTKLYSKILILYVKHKRNAKVFTNNTYRKCILR